MCTHQAVSLHRIGGGPNPVGGLECDHRASSTRSDTRLSLVSAHLAGAGKMGPNDSRFGTGDVADINRYIKLGPLGSTFAAKERHVLLIDEVDKADLEFPNDLLRELDEMRFSIVETNEEVGATQRPVTPTPSHNEKN